jgi:hypothetical protein
MIKTRTIAITVAVYAVLIGGLFSTGFLLANGWPTIDASPHRDLLYRIGFLVLPFAILIAVVHIAFLIRFSAMMIPRATNPPPKTAPKVSTQQEPARQESVPRNNGAPKEKANAGIRKSFEIAILTGVGGGVVTSGLFLIFLFTSSDPEAGMGIIALPVVIVVGSIAGFVGGLLFSRA